MRVWTQDERKAAWLAVDTRPGDYEKWPDLVIEIQCEVTALREALEDALVVIKCSNSSGQNTCDHCRVETEKFRALLDDTK